MATLDLPVANHLRSGRSIDIGPTCLGFILSGRLPPRQLAQLLSISDLHLYLTAPFVLSWSLMNAMSCGCKIVASATAPVREMIRDGETGLLVDFFDVDGLLDRAIEVLDRPQHYAALAAAGRELIETRYSIPVCLNRDAATLPVCDATSPAADDRAKADRPGIGIAANLPAEIRRRPGRSRPCTSNSVNDGTSIKYPFRRR